MHIAGEYAGVNIEAVQAMTGRNPQVSVVVLSYRRDIVVAEATIVPGDLLVCAKR